MESGRVPYFSRLDQDRRRNDLSMLGLGARRGLPIHIFSIICVSDFVRQHKIVPLLAEESWIF